MEVKEAAGASPKVAKCLEHAASPWGWFDPYWCRAARCTMEWHARMKGSR